MKVKFIVFFIVLPILAGAVGGSYFALIKGVPSIAELKAYKDAPSTKIYADDDTLLGEIKLDKGTYMPLEKMPRHLLNAVIAIEDSHFWTHSGIDYFAILRAAINDIRHRKFKEGASTITQQLAKITFLSPEKTIKRKLREVALASKMEKQLKKEEILELYLNRAYFGHGAYGVEQASRVYFGKTISKVSLSEAALLVGLLRAPAIYSPFNHMKRAKNRQKLVLSRMEAEGLIDSKQRRQAEKEDLTLNIRKRTGDAKNYFIDYVRKKLEARFGVDTVYKGGLRVYTTLDAKAQETAGDALAWGLRAHDKRQGWRGPLAHKNLEEVQPSSASTGFRDLGPSVGDTARALVTNVVAAAAYVKVRGVTASLPLKNARWVKNILTGPLPKEINLKDMQSLLKPGDVILVKVTAQTEQGFVVALEQEPEVQGAVVAIDPNTGYIRVLVGGYDYKQSEYNRAVFARRQPGSAFKPFIYATAMDYGYTPASILIDEETTYQWGPEDEWSPQNYDEDFHGPTRLRDALAYSRNVVTVKLVKEIGLGRVIKATTPVCLKDNVVRDLTVALGSVAMTPLELTFCYSVFPTGGMKMRPIAVKYITDKLGRVIESNDPGGTRVLSQQTAFLATSMLQDVVNYGTGWRARRLKRPVGGKTGTTNEFRDAWFMGFTTELVTGVWVGFDDMRTLGEKETGSRTAAPIWVKFMKAVLKETEPEEFPVPDGIVKFPIDKQTGLLANEEGENTVMEYFKEGTEPMRPLHFGWEVNFPRIWFQPIELQPSGTQSLNTQSPQL